MAKKNKRSPETLTTLQILHARGERANKMLTALRAETDRGSACVGDALLDELLDQVFRQRFVNEEKLVEELLSFNQPLGSHGARSKVAYALGWIGPKTYGDIKGIRRVRNSMAHDLDVDSFDHQEVKDIVDGFRSLAELKRTRLAHRRDKFLLAVNWCIMQLWALLDDANHSPEGTDRPILTNTPELETAVNG
jgi:DNA-binding MltR family transcriptional regulator